LPIFPRGTGIGFADQRPDFKAVRDQFWADFASGLGVEPAKVTEAWQAAEEKAKATLAAQRDAWVSALAAQLGVDKEKVAAALQECGGAKRFARGR
jgi:hypothetical protein